MVTTQDQAGPVWFGPSNQVFFSGLPIESENLIQFLSPVQGLLYTSSEAITTSLRLEAAARRNAESAIPAGVLRQISGEPLSGQELADLASLFNAARMTNQTAALSESLTYEATTATPDKMMLVESRDFQARELCRAANIPNYLAGIDQGSYQYTTSAGARADLYLFGAKAFIDCISETLSSDNVLPHGTYVKFDVEEYLSESYMSDSETEVQIETPMPNQRQNPMDTPSEVMND
jgi:phage portal protein BeeE